MGRSAEEAHCSVRFSLSHETTDEDMLQTTLAWQAKGVKLFDISPNDVFLNNMKGGASVLVTLEGHGSNAEGIGARLVLEADLVR